MLIKLTSVRQGPHLRAKVWVGPDPDHFALAGALVMQLEEWEVFEAAVRLGAAQDPSAELLVLTEQPT